MPFLNLAFDYEDNPKTRRLIGLLGRGAEMLPIRIWIYCGKFHAKDGRMEGYTPKEIEAIVKWWGRSGEALAALIKTGFLDKIKNGYQVHDWKEHQGHIYALKMRNKKVARNRWKNIKKEHSSVDTSGIPKDTTSIPRSVPFQSFPNHTEKSLTLEATALRARPEPNGQDTDTDLIDEIVRFCDDEKSRGAYIKAYRDHGEGLLREAFGELKMRLNEGQSIGNPGGYIMSLLKKWSKENAGANGH